MTQIEAIETANFKTEVAALIARADKLPSTPERAGFSAHLVDALAALEPAPEEETEVVAAPEVTPEVTDLQLETP